MGRKKARILISNDDGISSAGLMELARELSKIAHVTVVAPEREQSTMGHALTLHKPVRLFHVSKDHGIDMWALSGTPADCVFIGIRNILKTKPDIIVSGINRGVNLGNDIYYSGTIAAAREGAVMGISAVAFSLDYEYVPGVVEPEAFRPGAKFARRMCSQILHDPLPQGTMLNVNFPNRPPDKVKGVRVAKQGFRMYSDRITARQDFRGNDYYWLGGRYIGFKKIKGSDCEVVDNGYISVTPLKIDVTHYEYMNELSQWRLFKNDSVGKKRKTTK